MLDKISDITDNLIVPILLIGIAISIIIGPIWYIYNSEMKTREETYLQLQQGIESGELKEVEGYKVYTLKGGLFIVDPMKNVIRIVQ